MPKLIDKWHKKWSVWLLGFSSAMAVLEPALPQLQAMLPPHWYAYAFAATLIARMIQQVHE